MSTGSLSLLDSQRESASLLPALIFGYIYTKYDSLPVCCSVDHVQFIEILSPEPVLILGLALVSLVTGTGVYTIAVLEKAPSSIQESAGWIFGKFISANLWISLILFFLAPFFLLVRICQGDLVVNTLLFVWSGIVLTTVWSVILKQLTEVDELIGFMN